MSRDRDHSKDTVKTSEHPRASLKPPRRGAEVGGFFVQTDMCACSFVRQLAPRLKSWQCSENLVDRISASVNTTRDQSRTTQNQRSHIFFFFCGHSSSTCMATPSPSLLSTEGARGSV